VSCLRLSKTLKAKAFVDTGPAHSVHLSCSMENEKREGDMLGATAGAEIGKEIGTETLVANGINSNATPRATRIKRDI